MREYNRVQAHNHPCVPKEKRDQMLALLGGGAGDTKSALFARLLSGKPALIHAPPCSHSYPWYGAIEEIGPHEVEAQIIPVEEVLEGERDMLAYLERSARDDSSFLAPQEQQIALAQQREIVKTAEERGLPAVAINRQRWRVTEIIRPGAEYLVTYGKWADLGFQWRISRDRVPAAEAEIHLVCWHDKSKERITSVDELLAEARWHVMQYVESLAKSMAPPQPSDLRALLPHGEEHLRAFIDLEAEELRHDIEKRLQAGKPAVPEGDEIEAMVTQRFNSYLESRADWGTFEVGADGLLYVTVWRLTRLAPVELLAGTWMENGHGTE